MNEPSSIDHPEYFVVVNERGEYALWPREALIPSIWTPIGPPRGRLAAFRWMAANCPDMCGKVAMGTGQGPTSCQPDTRGIVDERSRSGTAQRCGNCQHYDPLTGPDDPADVGFCNSEATKDVLHRWVIGFIKADTASCPFYQPHTPRLDDEAERTAVPASIRLALSHR